LRNVCHIWIMPFALWVCGVTCSLVLWTWWAVITEKWSINYTLLSTLFNPLPRSTNQELFELWLTIKVATVKNTDDINYKRKPPCTTTKLICFTVSRDEEGTKEDTVLRPWRTCAVICQKHLSGWRDIKLWKIQACSLSKPIMLVWRLVNQSAESFFFKFCINFLETFRVDLKTCLGLVVRYQGYLIIIWAHGPCLFLNYKPLQWLMI